MKNNILKLFLLIIFFNLNSCDILRFSRFDVTSWTPGGGYHPDAEKIIISLNFSHDPDRASVERYFSLTTDSGKIKGNFIWEGKKLTFNPIMPFEKNNNYTLNISAEAHDTNGLSIDTAFEQSFSTKPDTERPALLSFYPEMYSEAVDPETKVRLCFSVPIPLSTLYENVSFTPSMTGFWKQEDNGKTAIFTPLEKWTHNTRYELYISTSLTDYNGTNIRDNFISIFTIGADRETPNLLYSGRILKDKSIVTLKPDINGYSGAAKALIENEGWEKEDKLLLVFSKPVDSLSVKNCLNVDGASGLFMETTGSYETEIVFYFESKPVYESRFTFRLKAGVKDNAGNVSKDESIYRVFANGKHSKPPSLAGIRLPMAPESEINQEVVFFSYDSLFELIPLTDEHYPSGKEINTWIELYFTTATDASIEPFSLMELFKIETSNNVLAFSPRQVKTKNFTVCEPQAAYENLERLEITGILTNSINFGVVNFLISAGLKDNIGNKNENLLRISLIK